MPRYTETRPLYKYSPWFCDNMTEVDKLKALENKPPEGYIFDRYERQKRTEAERTNPVCFGDFLSLVDKLRIVYKLRYNRTNMQYCCMGIQTNAELCDPAWKWETPACDQAAIDYCEYNQNNPECGCLLTDPKAYASTKLLGPPECVDARCAAVPRAYKIKSQREKDCKIVNCIMDNVQFEIKDLGKVNVAEIAQNCGLTESEVVQRLTKQREAEERKKEAEENPPPEFRELYQRLSFWLIVGGAVAAIGGGVMVYADRPKN